MILIVNKETAQKYFSNKEFKEAFVNIEITDLDKSVSEKLEKEIYELIKKYTNEK
jgi:hypothetical protein